MMAALLRFPLVLVLALLSAAAMAAEAPQASVKEEIAAADAAAAAAVAPSGMFLEPKAAGDASAALLDGLGVSLGEEFKEGVARRMDRVEADLRLMYAAMPKNSLGRLAASTVRYMLHRVLRRRWGWIVKHVDPEGAAWDVGSPTDVFEGTAPKYVQHLFEKHLSTQGFSLREVAVMAAAIESLALKDALRRVEAARVARCMVLGLPPTGPWAQSVDVQKDLETYMRSYILGPRNASRMSLKVVRKLQGYNMSEMYPAWQSTMDFVGEVREVWVPDPPMYKAKDFKEAKHDWKAVESAVEEINERFGQFQDRECKNLKQQLLMLEDPECPGYVRLSRFYESALNRSKWQFTENRAYLRDSGALEEETDPQNPSVRVANYMASPSNCVAFTGMHALCCMDECDGLLSSLEAQLGRPDATPVDIARRVAALPSSSEPVRGTLSPPLLRRLEQIADVHGGRVPLHGRLFAQWLHNVYPRECSYPVLSNTSHPRRALDWKWATGKDAYASTQDMQGLVRVARAGVAQVKQLILRAAGAGEEGPPTGAKCHGWSYEEELVAPVPSSGVRQATFSSAASGSLYPVLGTTGLLAVVALMTMVKGRRPKHNAALEGTPVYL